MKKDTAARLGKLLAILEDVIKRAREMENGLVTQAQPQNLIAGDVSTLVNGLEETHRQLQAFHAEVSGEEPAAQPPADVPTESSSAPAARTKPARRKAARKKR